jgi:DNA end-binding protein Ku
MVARAYWKGYLRLSLVNIGVELYSASTSSSRLRLHQIHEPTGKRIRYQKVAEGVGPVDKDEIVKGFETDGGKHVILKPEELDEIKLESKSTIDLVQFVEHCEIDPRYFEKPYYVVPRNEDVAAEGFAVLREALRQSGKVALGQMAARGRDYVVAIRPCGDGLLLETLRYADEIRESDRFFEDIPDITPDKEMLSLASELIERKEGPFEADAFKSQYSEALRDLIEEKRKEGSVKEADESGGGSGTGGGEVVDLMAALKKSVGQGKKKGRKSTKKSSAA